MISTLYTFDSHSVEPRLVSAVFLPLTPAQSRVHTTHINAHANTHVNTNTNVCNTVSADAGFNLAKSNALPLDRDVPDSRPEDCKKIVYPSGMPKVR